MSVRGVPKRRLDAFNPIGEAEFTKIELPNFPIAALEAIELMAAKDNMPPEDWIVLQCLATLGANGLDPCPNWKPQKFAQ